MHKSLLKLLLAAAALLLSAAVHALGMGGINVTTALGQPLQADIELVAVSRTDRAELVARLASADDYKAAGLQYPYGNKFKFKLEAKPNGDPYLLVSSDQPINDPFVSLLVELTWPSGKMLREYTFLLDPPGYTPDQPGLADLRVVAPAAEVVTTGALIAPVDAEIPAENVEPALPVEAATTPTEDAGAGDGISLPAETIPATEGLPTSGVAAETGEAAETQKTAPKTVEIPPPAVEPLPAIPEWVTVPRGSTMYELADQYKSSDMSVERMLVAMYRANANEFGGRNMNRIKAGKILRLPDERELAKVTQSDAEREIRVQTADWNTYRQKLASAAAVSTRTQATQQVAVGKISSSVIDHAPIAKETAKEVLKLSKGEAPGDQAIAGSGGKGLTDQDKKNAAQEEAIAKAKALEEERMRAAMREQNLKDAQLLAQLKAEKAELEAKLLAQQAAKPETKPEAVPAVPDSKVKVEAAAKPPVKPAAVTPPPATATEPTLVEQVLEEPLYLAAGAGLLLVLGGLGFVAVSRKKKTSFGEEAGSSDVGEITGRLTAPVVPSPDTGDFTKTVMTSAVHSVAPGQPAHEPEAVDPISEADLFLSFGRDGQAEEILREALKTMPSNHQIHLKLLGIYSSRQDTDSFSTIARQLKDSGDEYAWEQAVEMGRKLEPSNPMYGGSGSMEDTRSATVQMPAFNVGGSAESAAPAKPAALDMDFDLNLSPKTADSSPEQNFLGDMETTTVLSSSHAEAEKSASMDFDITSTRPQVGGDGTQDASEGMVFDVTGSYSTTAPAAEPEARAPDIDLGMAFTMDFPVEKTAVKPAPLAPDLSGISLNFDDEPAASAPAGVSASGGGADQFQEVATKLDLAKAYQEMGDSSGAREILDEVLREGNAEQRQAAQDLLDQLY